MAPCLPVVWEGDCWRVPVIDANATVSRLAATTPECTQRCTRTHACADAEPVTYRTAR
jgi:hypothetical protein